MFALSHAVGDVTSTARGLAVSALLGGGRRSLPIISIGG